MAKMVHSSGLIVFRRRMMSRIEYLMLQHSKLDHDGAPSGGHWAPPKGHVELGETDYQAAVRETKEEAGLNISDYRILPGFRTEAKYELTKGRKTVTFFLAELINKSASIQLSDEHVAYAWLSLEQACERIDQRHVSLKKVLRDAADFLAKK